MGLADLTVDKIRQVCTAQSYERGASYYNSGRITSVRLAGGAVRAIVEGTDVYNVELAWKGEGGRGMYYCDCPYSYEGECKHVVAVLLHVRDHSAEMIREAGRALSAAKRLLDGAGEGRLREFLAVEMAGDLALAERFARGAGAPPPAAAGPADPSEEGEGDEGEEEVVGVKDDGPEYANKVPAGAAAVDYFDRVSSMYRAETAAWRRAGATGCDDYGHVDLKGPMGEAAALARSGDMAGASRAYGQIASAVSDYIDEVIGNHGPHLRTARTAIARWAACMDKSGPADDERRECVSDALSGYRGDARFSAAYESALWSLCRSDGDLVHLLDLVAPHMPDPIPADGSEGAGSRRVKRVKGPLRRRRRDLIEQESPERIRMLRIQVEALERLGRKRDINRLLEEHGRADPAACAMRVGRLAGSGDKAGAVRAADKGLDLFGNDERIMAAAEAVYGGREAGRVPVLSGLFMRTLDWSYYDKLRGLPGWRRERAAVLEWLSSDEDRYEMLVRMLVSEGMHGRALREIAEGDDAALFAEYAETVAAGRPRAYLAAYGRCVAGLADSARSSWDYSRVAQHLKHMSGIEGGKEAAARIAADIVARNPSKRAHLKALAPYVKRASARTSAAAARSGGGSRAGGPRAARGRARPASSRKR